MSLQRSAATTSYLLLTLILLATAAHADSDGSNRPLRLATVAPQGSAWALEFEAMKRFIESKTDGAVKLKIYYGGVAGDEITVGERIQRGQLDGAISGGMLCNQVMPSMRVLMLLGVFQSRAEAYYVANELMPTFREEASKSGYAMLGAAGVGPIVIFSKDPIDSMSTLRKAKAFRWKFDDVSIAMMRNMQLTPVGLDLPEVVQAYEEGRIDVITTPPMAALAFQWYTKTRYLTDLRMGYLMGCLLIAERSLDKLTPEQQKVVRNAGTKLVARIDEVGTKQDEQLIEHVYAQQGLQRVPVSRKFKAAFFAAARKARESLSEELMPPELVDRVMGLLADYRAESPSNE